MVPAKASKVNISASTMTNIHLAKSVQAVSSDPDLYVGFSDVVGRNRLCLWKEGSVHVPICKIYLVTEAERKHVRRRAI